VLVVEIWVLKHSTWLTGFPLYSQNDKKKEKENIWLQK